MDLIRKRWIVLAIALSVLGFLYGQNQNASFKNITAQQVYEKIQKGEKLILVDVRTHEEFNGPLGHIEGARLIPLDSLAERYGELLPVKDREIIIYCRSGNRSRMASAFLAEKGLKVENMLGGMKAWNDLNKQKK